MDNQNVLATFNSDQYYQKQQKNIQGGLILGVLFVTAHLLNRLHLLPFEMDNTTGIFGLGMAFIVITLLVMVKIKFSTSQIRIFYDVDHQSVSIRNAKGEVTRKIYFADYLIKGNVVIANLGKTVTCTLKLENREGKKENIGCFLDQKSFEEMVDLIGRQMNHTRV